MRRLLIPATAVLVLALSACSFSASLTVPASRVADAAENALEQQIGSRPDIDCGDDDVKLIDGTVVDCELTDPATGSVFDTTVTISNVDATKYSVDVQVADEPQGGAPSSGPTDTATDAAAETLTVTSQELGDTASGSLEGQIGANTIVCPGGSQDIYTGFTITCTLIVGGDQQDATITITDADPTTGHYALDVTTGQ